MPMLVRPSAIRTSTSRSRSVSVGERVVAVARATSDATTCGSSAEPPGPRARPRRGSRRRRAPGPSAGSRSRRCATRSTRRAVSTCWESTSTPTPGWASRIHCAARVPSSVNVGGIRTSTTARSGSCPAIAASSRSASPTAAMTSWPASSNSRGEALAQQRLVLGDHDPHGSSAVTVVPAPGGLSTRQRPAVRGHAVGEPGEAGARPTRTAPPTPSSATETTGCRSAVRPGRTTCDAPACLTALVSASLATK